MLQAKGEGGPRGQAHKAQSGTFGHTGVEEEARRRRGTAIQTARRYFSHTAATGCPAP